MLKHIVMMKLKDMDPAEKMSNLNNLIQMLEDLREQIPVIDRLEVGQNFSSSPVAMDLVLHTQFQGEEELDAYRVHPRHQKVLAFIKEVVAESRVVDYWV